MYLLQEFLEAPDFEASQDQEASSMLSMQKRLIYEQSTCLICCIEILKMQGREAQEKERKFYYNQKNN